ncbi:MAG TPA: nucleotidyl transferase AbiEii/AbiGii toxin family protein [Acidimicrobiales bacterium]|nr:nucleotidyl transferase AbiEii/AbiGii toxin family protein [Acidimicrobiales bacterium]
MITQGYLSRHFQGRGGMGDAALLDVAQDYALQFLSNEGIFELGVVLKGGTSLRKLRAGNAGRFSTDLDFAAPDADTGELLLDTLDGAELFDVRFSLTYRESLRARLVVTTPLGEPRIPARVEISPRPLWLPTEAMTPIALPVHGGYEFPLPDIPAPALEESMAEKLAAWRRRQKIRDLYDLYLFGQGALNEPLIRRLLVLKVWHDVVNDGLGSRPFDPAEIVAGIDANRMPSEDIGLLTRPVEPAKWMAHIRTRYVFVTNLDDEERSIARCNPGDSYKVSRLVEALREWSRGWVSSGEAP